MRILIAVHGYPPTHNGGAERRAERTARRLSARGHDVRVVCVEAVASTANQAHAEDGTQDGVFVRRLTLARSETFRQSYDHPQAGQAVARFIDEWTPDAFHLFSGYLLSASALRAAIEFRVPTLVSLTDYWWICHQINLLRTNGTRCDEPSISNCARCYAEMFRRYRLPAKVLPPGARAFWRFAEKIPALHQRLGFELQAERTQILMQTLKRADALIAPSQYLANLYIGRGVDPKRVRVWRQGVDVDRCLLKKPSPALRVGYLGQMKYHKGVDLALDAWARLRGDRPRELRLYGSDAGEEKYGARLRQRLNRLQNATWVGQFKGAEVWQVLADLDVLVVPSRWVENSPNTILEAQAVGIPIVGSNLGGVAELVQHEQNGLVFAVDDADDLARQFQRLLDEPALLARLRRGAMPFRTVNDEIDQLEGLYAQVTGRI